MTSSTQLNEAAKDLAVSQNYDLSRLIALQLNEYDQALLLPFVKECRRSRRYMTTYWSGRLTKNAITRSYVFKYNPTVIKKYIEQKSLDTEGVASLLLELSQNGLEYLRKKSTMNIMGGIEIEPEKLQELALKLS